MVVVETEGDRVDTELLKTLERFWPDRGAADGGDVLDPARPELMEIESALYEDDLAAAVRRLREHVGEPVGRQVGAASSAEVKVAAAGGLTVSEGAPPEGADVPIGVAPGPTQ